MTTSIGLAATLVLAAQTASSWECTRVTWCGDLVVGGGGHTVVAGNLGREPIRIQIDGIVRDLAADAGRVAVACDWAGVRIFDPELGPRSIATIPTSDAALSVDLSERLLAIAEATAGVSLHDLHNASPILLRRWSLGGEIVGIQIEGDAIWAAAADGRYWRLEIDRVAGPWQVASGPSPARFMRLGDDTFLTLGGLMHRVRDRFEFSLEQEIVGGDTRWLAAGPAGVLRWTGAEAKMRAPRAETPALAWDLAVNGDRVAVAAGAAGITLWSSADRDELLYQGRVRPSDSLPPPGPTIEEPVAAPRAPRFVQVGALEIEEGAAKAVAAEGDFAYVAAGASGLRVIDVSRPSSPAEIGYYGPPGASQVYLDDVVLHEGHVIAGCDGAEDEMLFRIIDVSSPFDPVQISDWPGSYAWSYGMDVSPGRLYVGGSTGRIGNNSRMWIFDIREIGFPRHIGGIGMGGSGTYWKSATIDPLADHERMYAWHAPWDFHSLDVSDPRDIAPFTSGWGGTGEDIEIDGDLLHMALGYYEHGGYRAMRIDHQGGYSLEGDLELPESRRMSRLAARDDRVFGIGEGRLWVIDISNSTEPELLLEPLSLPGANDIFVDEDGYIYVTIAGEGLRIYRLIG